MNGLVPEAGKASTKAGDILRALGRIVYCYGKSGDMIGEDYGNETCNPAARYLMEKCPEEISDLISDMWREYHHDKTYEERLTALITKVLDWLDMTDLKTQPNTENMYDWEKAL